MCDSIPFFTQLKLKSTRMASRSPVKISDLIEHHGIKEAQLKNQFSSEHLARLALSRNFVWREWVGQFGLSEQQIKDIEVDVSLDGTAKAQKALNKWHSLYGILATYIKLAETFLEGGNALLAGDVCELLKGMITDYATYISTCIGK